MTGRESLLLGGALAVLAMGLGVLLGWYAAFDPTIPSSSGSDGSIPAPSSTFGNTSGDTDPFRISVRAILELPSPTPTNTPMPTGVPTTPPTPDYCTGAATRGALCQVPPVVTAIPTPTPFPACEDVMGTPENADDWCRWEG